MARFAAVMDEFDPRSGREKPTEGIALSEAEQREFIEELSGSLYLKHRVAKPALQRLDEALSSGGVAYYYDQLISIEHVLPQTVDVESEWSALFPDEKVREEWTHRIANLVFLTRRINTRALNWDFDRKKKEYFASKDGTSLFALTQDVLQTKRWTIEHLQERQKKLLDTLCGLWKLTAVTPKP